MALEKYDFAFNDFEQRLNELEDKYRNAEAVFSRILTKCEDEWKETRNTMGKAVIGAKNARARNDSGEFDMWQSSFISAAMDPSKRPPYPQLISHVVPA